MKFEYAQGATPLDLDEAQGLIPQHITTQAQLNEWEAMNILKAENWLHEHFPHKELLSIEFLKKIHKKMFEDTWKWAGQFRTTEKNIGVFPPMITTELKNLLDDVIYQVENEVFGMDEIAYRFHHRLVWIHPFANGNGRHARLISDLLLINLGAARFSWGNSKLNSNDEIRKKYIHSLRDADKGSFILLSEFVRS